MEYIHYGSNVFDISLFEPIYNGGIGFNKPRCGFWASPIICKNLSWKEWCEENDYDIDRLQESFIFELSPDANIYYVKSMDDILELYKSFGCSDMYGNRYLDYVKMSEEGYDGVEVEVSSYDIYFELYGWDCDSICIFNPDVIVL